MNTENTNWHQSVTGVLISDNKVLLARHTYGAGKNLLIVPGGYLNYNETPQEAVVREYKEETGITVEPKDIIAIRFNFKDWYVAFSLDYVSGEATSDNDENSEVVWLDIDEALTREDVPDLTKKLIQSAINKNNALCQTDYYSREQHGTYSLYAK
ncbi:MAG: NUDIX hydrolase [Eubacteriales bacterium]|nr:NUDIX hydrolase [Eubacteriales bacterium]